MLKTILILLSFTLLLNAKLTNAIAVIVNDTPITLYDIDDTMNRKHISHNQAIASLIDNTLYEQTIKKFNISASKLDINNYISKLANANNMSVKDFKTAVKRQQNYTQFWNQIKKRIINQKLIENIAKGQIKVAITEDLKLYYDNNINEFRKNKNSIAVVPFEQVKNKIFNKIMGQREQKMLKEYFDTLKITADIKVVR